MSSNSLSASNQFRSSDKTVFAPSIYLAERGWLPDSLIRYGIRRLCRTRLEQEQSRTSPQMPINPEADTMAIEVDTANEQHYEVPTPFYLYVLGDHLKYSGCLWSPDPEDNDLTQGRIQNLSEAEHNMLSLYAERAQIEDGQDILDLGCGWGSLSLWLAKRYPNCHITAVSNSRTQKLHIDRQIAQHELQNLEVMTRDVNSLTLDKQFDRIVSVEMMEHVRNHNALFNRISHWLKPDGLLFAHIFCHRNLNYTFETEGSTNWMGRYFFTGGIMPAKDTFIKTQSHLEMKKLWEVNGKHYALTAEAWLQNLDRHQSKIRALFSAQYGDDMAARWVQRWRIFFMACAEMFAYRNGEEWLVCHYLFQHPQK